MKRTFKIVVFVVVVAGLIQLAGGTLVGWGVLHPARRRLTPKLIHHAEQVFARVHARGAEFDVRSYDGVMLRGWKVIPRTPNGDWVMLFHGVDDNRAGMVKYARFLLADGYSLVMMDSRAQGVSGGKMVTYGWKERRDTEWVIRALYRQEKVKCLFALGESMGAAIALQSAGVDPRIRAVVAESSFSNLHEISYDYAGFHISFWLGKTLLRPAAWAAVVAMEREGHFNADKVSPAAAVAERPFPVFLICDANDHAIPCRHTMQIYRAASGPKELWVAPHSPHAGAIGNFPEEFQGRVLGFFHGPGAEACKAKR